jgi:hypothetical protein
VRYETSERRLGSLAVPPGLNHYLNEDQMRAYHTMQGFSWHMYFTVALLFSSLLHMINDEGTLHVAAIEQEGHYDMNPTFELRG